MMFYERPDTQGLTLLALTKPPTTSDAAVLAERIVKHLFNYLSGFTGSQPSADAAIPMSIMAKWYDNFMSKLRAGGIGFLERQE